MCAARVIKGKNEKGAVLKTENGNKRALFNVSTIDGRARDMSIEERIKNYDKAKYSFKKESDGQLPKRKKKKKEKEKDSRLKRNLLKEGVECPPYNHQTHHIVGRTEPEAKGARKILEKYDIDIDAASNGVMLPTNKNKYVRTESFHRGGHLEAYWDVVNRRLEEVDNVIETYKLMGNQLTDEDAKEMIGDTLHKIRVDLLRGKLKIHN